MTIKPLYRVLAGALSLAIWFTAPALAQDPSGGSRPALGERLGYPADAKLLIVHADDIGVAHSVNAASIAAFRDGVVNSGSIMVPCPWFPEIAAFARANPDLDLGLHLTLTSEWKHYRWGTVLPADQVPTLLDSLGFMYATEQDAARHMDPGEAEAELRAQVERALAFGIRPTHLDTHMATLMATPALFEAYLRVGRDYGLPVFVPAVMREMIPHVAQLLTPDDIVIDHVAMAGAPWLPPFAADGWMESYAGLIETLEPGVTQLIVHIGYDDAELRAVTVDHPDFGAAWRQRDFDVVTDPAFRRLLEQHDVQLITWREIGALPRQ